MAVAAKAKSGGGPRRARKAAPVPEAPPAAQDGTPTPETAKGKGGRPTDYTPELAAQICELIAGGKSLRSICGKDGIPVWETIRRWLNAHEEFRAQYARAREDQADVFADEIMEISQRVTDADTVDGKTALTPDQARVAIDARKWMAGKLRPRVYGDSGRLELDPSDSFQTMMQGLLKRIDGTSRGL